ncbi:unnamed protein product, partial [Rhizoctonia solani]
MLYLVGCTCWIRQLVPRQTTDHNLRAFGVISENQVDVMIVHAGHTGWVQSVAFSPDRKSVASGSLDNTVRIWNANNSSPFGEPLRGHRHSVNSVSYSPLGNLIASGSDDDTIRLWDTNTCQQSGVPLTGDSSFFSVAFSPDARLIASGCRGLFGGPTA